LKLGKISKVGSDINSKRKLWQKNVPKKGLLGGAMASKDSSMRHQGYLS
jgi:hypothetical protein